MGSVSHGRHVQFRTTGRLSDGVFENWICFGMVSPRVCVLRAPGTNCDVETAFAFETCGGTPTRLHLFRLLEQPSLLDDFEIVCIPGGFSYGDDIGAGVIFSPTSRPFGRGDWPIPPGRQAHAGNLQRVSSVAESRHPARRGRELAPSRGASPRRLIDVERQRQIHGALGSPGRGNVAKRLSARDHLP